MKQQNMFQDDPVDPQIAKVADRVAELLDNKRRVKEQLEIREKDLIGLMNKAEKTKIHHKGKVFEIAITEQRSKLKVKDQKPKKAKRTKPA